MSRPITTGNIIRHLTGCPCGRAFESDTPLAAVPDHVHNHQLRSGNGIHTCTGCSWQVETYTPAGTPATEDAVNAAFAKHLLTTAVEETA